MEPKLPEHCPGPPMSQAECTSGTSDNDLCKQLRNKEEELQQLRRELQSYTGKLRGYETLGQLYAESQSQCSEYKLQNDELVRQLSSLTRRISPAEHYTNLALQPPAPENESESALERGSDREKTHKSAWMLDFTEEGDRGGGESEASLSSPSFVNIESSSTDNSSHVRRDVIEPRAQDKSRADDAAVTTDSVSLSVDIEQLTAELRDVGHHRDPDSSSYQHVSSNLIRTSLAVLKLEKQTRVQKAMMEQMTLKLTELQGQLDAKNQTISQLQEDRVRLVAEVKSTKAALLDAKTKSVTEDTDMNRDASAVDQESGDWLEVEKRVSSAGHVDIAAVSTTEVELKRRVDKLSSMITELVAVNRSWDEHSKQQEMSHSRQVAALNAELTDIRQRLDERRKCDDERQKEFDELLLSAKKQREDEEMAKEEALSQLHVEKRLRANAEERCVEFSRKMAELESQLCALQAAGLTNTSQLVQSTQQPSSMSSTSSAPASDRDMMLELQMLREQVTVFKEDFDQERRDREASRVSMEHLDTKLRETNIELASTKKKLMDTLASLRATKTENLQLKDRFQKVADDLKTLQRQAVSRPAPPTPGRPYAPPVTPVYDIQPQWTYGPTSGLVWSCLTCTYENPAQRSSCEMCGRVKEAEQVVYRRDADVGRHRVAGLHEYQVTTPFRQSDWPRLPSSNLETDQSSHQ